MKTKKLNLNKVTVSTLENSELEHVQGGLKYIPPTDGAFSCSCPPPEPLTDIRT